MKTKQMQSYTLIKRNNLFSPHLMRGCLLKEPKWEGNGEEREVKMASCAFTTGKAADHRSRNFSLFKADPNQIRRKTNTFVMSCN